VDAAQICSSCRQSEKRFQRECQANRAVSIELAEWTRRQRRLAGVWS